MILVIVTLHFHFQNCELELSCVLAELFSIFLKESSFLDCWKIVSVVPLFKNVGERSTAKNYHSVSLLCVVNKFCEKHVSNRLLDDLEKCGLFSGFQYGFRSSQSTVDFLTVVSERIAWAFSRSRATRVVACDTSKAFERVWHAITNLSLMEFQVPYLALFLVFSVEDGFEWFLMESL